MGDEALQSLTNLLESVPGWTTKLEDILQTSTQRQKEILFEVRPAGTPARSSRKLSKSSSLLSGQSSKDECEQRDGALVAQGKGDGGLLQARMHRMTQSDVLRLSQRKRKTASALSDLSGPPTFRSRTMVMVYYDGEIQKQFEMLVRGIGGSRNALRKGKMVAKVDALSRTGSGSSSEASSSEDRATLMPNKFTYKTTRAVRVTSNLVNNNGTTEAFDRLDGLLEKMQAACERAAHQILRDGDCTIELRMAKDHAIDLKKVAEDYLPVLQRRAEKTLERQKRERDREKPDVAVAEKYRSPSRNGHKELENPFSSPASLEADLEADDDDDEDDDFGFEVGAMQLDKFGIRSTRAPVVAMR